MKTIKTTLATLVALFTVSAAVASGAGGLKVNMESDNSDLMSVEISSVKVSHFEIDVTNVYGDNLYSMTTDVPINSFKKKFDFTELEDGTYMFSVKIDKESSVKTFEVNNGDIEIIKERRSIEPYFRYENELLKFTYINTQLEDVSLKVYDKNNQLVADAKLGNDLSISKAVDFSDLRFGDYDVVITNDMDYYEYTVSIK